MRHSRDSVAVDDVELKASKDHLDHAATNSPLFLLAAALRQIAKALEHIDHQRFFPYGGGDGMAIQIADVVAERVETHLNRRLYSIKQTAEMLGVSERTIENMLRQNPSPLSSLKLGSRRLITAASIERLVEEEHTDGVD